MAKVSRRQIIDALHGALNATSYVRAAWLGGSDGSNRTDEWSDVDIQIIVEDDEVQGCFDLVHRTLEELSPFEHQFRFPMPTPHGHEQEFILLRDASPMAMIDMVIMKKSENEDHFLARELHGEPLVLFDRDGLAQSVSLDHAPQVAKLEKRLPMLRTLFYIYQPMVTKAVNRRHHLDAMSTYIKGSLGLLVELLRMRYCPERFDFGPRYLDRDLPADMHEEIAGMALVGDIAEIEKSRARAEEIFTEQLRALDAGEWRLELPAEITDWPGKR
ncbi:MAG: hypothetical protein GY835_14310 [bacterium]|nr:hypothetical protein [bacterium]